MKAGIAGGGIMGKLLAFSLVNTGWQVTLFDQGAESSCSLAAAGLLTPVAELEKNDLIIYQLGEEALNQHWPVILEKLNKKIYFRQTGSVFLSHPQDSPSLLNTIQIISSKLKNNYFCRLLAHDDLCQLEPEIAAFNSAYYFPHEGQIDSQMTLRVLKEYLIEKDVTFFDHTRIDQVQPGKLTSSNKTYSFDLVLDCRGLHAKGLFHDLRGVRGELIWLEAPHVFITRPIRFSHPRYSLYLVPRPHQQYLIGASEIESDDGSPISVRTTLELLTAAYYINSKFGEARLLKTVTGCRPALSDHLPKIKYTEGLAAVNGLYRHGFLIAPTLVHDIMQWIARKSIDRYMQLWEKYA